MIFLFHFTDWQSIIFEALPLFIPEYLLVIGILLLILIAPFQKRHFISPYLSLFFLAFETIFFQNLNQTYFNGLLAHSYFYEKIAWIGVIGSMLTVILGHLTLNKAFKTEHYIYILTGQLALQTLALSKNWILSFIAFELLSFVGYFLILILKEKKSTSESSIKYFIYGAFSSGVMLYGISMYYGIHGNILLNNEWKFIKIEYISLGLILVGIFFKLSVFPLHFWTPEVYHGAPIAVAAWLSNVSKLAGIALFFSVFFPLISSEFQSFLWIIATITMFVGNFGILREKHIFRLMGYSSIAHSGFLFMAMVVNQSMAQATVLFYALISIPLTFLVFYSAHQFSQISQNVYFTEWNGLGKKYPWTTLGLVTGLAGLIGLPPTIGFIGKLNLVWTVWSDYIKTHNIFALFCLISFVLNTLLALAAYSRVVIILLLRNLNQEPNYQIKFDWIFVIPLAFFSIFFGIYGFDILLQWLM